MGQTGEHEFSKRPRPDQPSQEDRDRSRESEIREALDGAAVAAFNGQVGSEGYQVRNSRGERGGVRKLYDENSLNHCITIRNVAGQGVKDAWLYTLSNNADVEYACTYSGSAYGTVMSNSEYYLWVFVWGQSTTDFATCCVSTDVANPGFFAQNSDAEAESSLRVSTSSNERTIYTHGGQDYPFPKEVTTRPNGVEIRTHFYPGDTALNEWLVADFGYSNPSGSADPCEVGGPRTYAGSFEPSCYGIPQPTKTWRGKRLLGEEGEFILRLPPTYTGNISIEKLGFGWLSNAGAGCTITQVPGEERWTATPNGNPFEIRVRMAYWVETEARVFFSGDYYTMVSAVVEWTPEHVYGI